MADWVGESSENKNLKITSCVVDHPELSCVKNNVEIKILAWSASVWTLKTLLQFIHKSRGRGNQRSRR